MTKKLPRGVFERDGLYWIRYADGTGKIRREKVGPFVGQAGAAYQKRKSEVREGKFFPNKVHQRVIPFSEIAQDYLVESRKSKKRSHGHNVGRMATLLRLWRDVPVAELSPGRIQGDLSDAAEQEEWLPATFNRYRALCSGTFGLAVKKGKALFNPVRGTEHRQENNERDRYLSDEEQDRILAYIREGYPERELQVLVALYTGMRRSEQYVTQSCPDGGLRWDHINFRAGVITLPRSKHGKKRHIPMHRSVQEILSRLARAKSSPYVFPGSPPDKWFPEVCKATQIENFTWHCLRHTFASRLVLAGVPLRKVQELMGHRSIVTTTRYAHLSQGDLAEAVGRLEPPTSTATSTEVAEMTRPAVVNAA